MGTRDRAADPWAPDGREFLRKKLIGREVVVAMEYNRKIPLSAAEVALHDGAQERVIACANVELAGGPAGWGGWRGAGWRGGGVGEWRGGWMGGEGGWGWGRRLGAGG
jgi:hypothetical protein